MTDGECSKCGSNSVYAVESYGHQRNLMIGLFGRLAKITYFVCTRCGYFESYILDENSLIEIERKGRHV